MSATDLDRVFHERGRLAICSMLVAKPEAGRELYATCRCCGLTDGNLNRHLHALAEEKIVETERRTGNGRPQTIVRVTKRGRTRFLEYIDALEAVVREVQKSTSSSTSSVRTTPTRNTSQ